MQAAKKKAGISAFKWAQFTLALNRFTINTGNQNALDRVARLIQSFETIEATEEQSAIIAIAKKAIKTKHFDSDNYRKISKLIDKVQGDPFVGHPWR